MQDNPFACFAFGSPAGPATVKSAKISVEKNNKVEKLPILPSDSSEEVGDARRARSDGSTADLDGDTATFAKDESAAKRAKRAAATETSPTVSLLESKEEVDASCPQSNGSMADSDGNAATPANEEGQALSRLRHFPAHSSVDGESVVEEKGKDEAKYVGAKAEAANATAANPATLKSVTPQPDKPKRKYRQAREDSDGAVEILCFACRRNPSRKIQKTMGCFFKAKPVSSVPTCSRCRQPLQKPVRTKGGNTPLTRCPFITRLDGYKRLAAENELPFDLSDSKALSIMRMPCSLCGEKAGMNGGGLTRLRIWPARHEGARNGKGKQFMGPFCAENLAPACGMCNLMKGHRLPREFVEAVRHVATHRAASLRRYEATTSAADDAPLESFGLYPHRFRNNITKRRRSNYITMSSTHTKTHSMTNEECDRITAMPCHYCGKETQPDADPPHYNGLDRLDSDVRVYSAATVVAACGDCNVMKYQHSEEVFLRHCLKVARFNRGVEFGENGDRRNGSM